MAEGQKAKKISSVDRVKADLARLGLEAEIQTMPASTRTAQDAASACGCKVAQIVKSLIFERHDDQSLVLLLIAGHNQADMALASDLLGTPLDRADPKKVRNETGFAIGGVAPLGHLCAIPVYMDPDLLQFDQVWAAAGAPNAVFPVDPKRLLEAIGARPFALST